MQINLFNIRFKEILKYLGWILFFGLLWLNGCSGNDKSVVKTKVVVPAVSGKFESKKPESKPLEIKQERISEVKKDGLVYVENPLNKKLLAENEKLKIDFSKMSDSLKSKAYEKAIELNRFSSKFEDDNLLLNIDGIVQGEIQEMTPSYTIKSKEVPIEIKQKETVFRLLLGGSLGTNKDFNQGVYKLDLDLQNKKGDVFTGEYLRINNQDYGLVGFKKSLFSIKR